MNKVYYPKLAAVNLKKNAKIYLPYLITCVGTVMMFYSICALTFNSQLKNVLGGEVLATILLYGVFEVGIFALIFLLYSNSFLMKRRKKEFGLYNILGMEKRHISKIIFYESCYVTLISLCVGLAAGVLFNKLIFLALLKMLHAQVPMGFEVPLPAIFITLGLFGGIFLLTLLNNLRQIHLVNPVELLKGGQVGEKEPKAKWFAAVLGLLCLGGGYTIAVMVEDPISAIFMFFIAVMLVIFGTYLLFGAGSIAVLKMLRKKKSYYYKTSHFISVSGMMYRMKQNAVGLANICILSTMVLVMISSTTALYTGMNDILTTRYPKEIMFFLKDGKPETLDTLKETVQPVLEKNQLLPQDATAYRYLSFAGLLKENKIETDREAINGSIMLGDLRSLFFMTLSDYQKSGHPDAALETSEDALLFYNRDSSYTGSTLEVFDHTFRVQVTDEKFVLNGFDSAQMGSNYYIVVKDEATLQALYTKQLAAYGEDSSQIKSCYGFELNADAQVKSDVAKQLEDTVMQSGLDCSFESRQASQESFYSLYGGLFFLGIFLGILFIMATVLIIYYKQISEGYDDKERFEIMQKVGMSRQEVKASIRSQVLTVFFLPLVTAGIHVSFALSVILKLLALLNMDNTNLFLLCTLGVFLLFALCYGVIYTLTAKAYYKIVS